MAGGNRLIFPIALLVLSVLFALYGYTEPGERRRDLSAMGFLSGLWRPVLISLALYAVIRILANGSGAQLRQIGNLAGGIATFVGKLCSFLILGLIALIMTDVVTRKIEAFAVWNADTITSVYGFSVSVILQDLQWHFHGILLLMTLGFGYIYNSHVRVDIFRETASRTGQAKIETFGLVMLAIPFMLVMIGFSWDLFYASFRGWEGSESMVGLGWRWIIKSFLVWGFCVALMAAVATLIRCTLFLHGDYDEQAIAEDQIQFFTDNDAMAKVIVEDNDGGQ